MTVDEPKITIPSKESSTVDLKKDYKEEEENQRLIIIKEETDEEKFRRWPIVSYDHRERIRDNPEKIVIKSSSLSMKPEKSESESRMQLVSYGSSDYTCNEQIGI